MIYDGDDYFVLACTHTQLDCVMSTQLDCVQRNRIDHNVDSKSVHFVLLAAKRIESKELKSPSHPQTQKRHTHLGTSQSDSSTLPSALSY